MSESHREAVWFNLYLAAIPLAFISRWTAMALYVLVAVIWWVPDRRIERVIAAKES